MMQFIETLYADPLLRFLADTTMRSFVIFTVAGVFAFCLRRKSAAMRGFVWSMTILGCLMVSLLSLVLPKWEVKVLPEMPIRSETYRLTDNARPSTAPVAIPVSIAPSQPSSETVGPTRVAPTPSQSNPVPARNGILTTMPWTDWVAVVWAGMSVFFLIRLIVGIGAVWHISARSGNFGRAVERLGSNWNRRVHVRLSNRITVPMVWSFLRPVILLPIDANHWQTERLRAVLLHELAHIKRWDWMMQMVAQVACAIYWFNPLVWFVARWMRIEAEQASDDYVLNAGYRSTDYAQDLLDITRNVKIAKAASLAAVAIARSSKIETRLRTVLAENLNRHPITKIAVGIGLLVLICFAIPIGTMRSAQAVSTTEVTYQKIQETSTSQPTPSESRSDESSNTEQIDENVEICKQHLVEIGKAIQAYHDENGDFPEWLSELHPRYLPDANLLLCPADRVGGKALFPPNIDPKMPVSYGYGLHPGYRESTPKNQAMYGDVLPLVRCRHHVNKPFECLNLSFAFKVYPSSQVWEYTPEEMYGTPEEVIQALENGLQQHADNEGFFHVSRYVYRALARLYIEVGREKDVDNLVNRFKSTMKPDDLQAHFDLGTMLKMVNRDKEVLEVFEKLEKRYPDNDYVLDELARIHEELGNAELAGEYRRKADPMSEAVGKVVSDFSATDLDGKPTSGVYTPDEMYETPEKAIEALEKGLQRQPDNERFFHVYHSLVRFYSEVGRAEAAENIMNRFKAVMKPGDIRHYFYLGDILQMMHRYEEMLQVFEKLEEQAPENRSVARKLAEIHEMLGNAELAKEYMEKAEPVLALLGKTVPDFSATDLDGHPISLQQYRGKVVLLDFWAVWCGPCLGEMPNVKQVYDTYKDQGFDIIGVSLDTDGTRLRDYLKENEIPWRQICSGQGWQSPLAQQYGINSIPAPWLIARDGKLITHRARGSKLEQLVVEALKSESKN